MACVTRYLATLIRLALLLAFAGVFSLYSSEVQAGTPSDSYTIQRYYQESNTEQTTTSTSFQTAVTMTFTPPATATFLVEATA